MQILHIAIIALADSGPLFSANAAHSRRGASAEERKFGAQSDVIDGAAERGALGGYAAGEDASISVDWREIVDL